MESSALLQSLLLFSQVIPGIFILATQDCPASWCKTAGDCPEPKNACPSVTGCRTAVVKDKCGFCRVCLKAIGESCRRKPFKLQDDMCERGLVCKASDDEWYCANMAPENIKIGRCEKGLCTSFKPKVDPLKTLIMTGPGITVEYAAVVGESKHSSTKYVWSSIPELGVYISFVLWVICVRSS